MCNFLEGNRGKNPLDNRPGDRDALDNETPEPDRRTPKPASDRPPLRPGTSAGRMYRRTADEDTDDSDGDDSIIDDLEYMRHFFH